MDNIELLFTRINSLGINYIVLRNYEELMHESFINSHPDIDFLCENKNDLVEAINAQNRLDYEDGVHYKVLVGDIYVPIDIREIGDGYYDDKWERDMLKSKTLYQGIIFAPNDENYYYSLLYHAIIQKDKISEDYMKIFKHYEMLYDIKVNDNYVKILDRYMERQGYKYTYPNDIGVGFNVRRSKRSLIEINSREKAKRNYIKIKRIIKKILNNIWRV